MAFDPYLADIMLWPANFAPRGWAFCDGRLLPINEHQALYALLGTTYGGNGQTNFALPDLRGRVPRGVNPGADQPGTQAGAETIVTEPQTVQQAVPGNQSVDFSAFLPTEAEVDVAQPHLGLNYVIALQGYFPSRN